MTKTVPLIMYMNDRRFIIGSVEIEGFQFRGEVNKEELLERFDIDPHNLFEEFALVAEPEIEKLKYMNIVTDKRVPPGEIRVLSTDEDFQRNEFCVLLEPKTLTLTLTVMPPKEKDPNA